MSGGRVFLVALHQQLPRPQPPPPASHTCCCPHNCSPLTGASRVAGAHGAEGVPECVSSGSHTHMLSNSLEGSQAPADLMFLFLSF